MALRILGSCIGCGACEAACRSSAISQVDSFVVLYAVDPLLCNDCTDCVEVCPVDAFETDPAWAVCFGRGCPLRSARYEGWRCSQGLETCEDCGSMLWQSPGGRWTCSLCREKSGERGARCPKTERARRARAAGQGAVEPPGAGPRATAAG